MQPSKQRDATRQQVLPMRWLTFAMCLAAAGMLAAFAPTVLAQGTAADYQRAAELRRLTSGKVLRTVVDGRTVFQV